MQKEQVGISKPWLWVQRGGFHCAELGCDGLRQSPAGGDVLVGQEHPCKSLRCCGYQRCVPFHFDNLTEVCSYSNQFCVHLHGQTPAECPCAGCGSAQALQGSWRTSSGCLMTSPVSRITYFFSEIFWTETRAALCTLRKCQTLEENLLNQTCSVHGLYTYRTGLLVNTFTSKRVFNYHTWELEALSMFLPCTSPVSSPDTHQWICDLERHVLGFKCLLYGFLYHMIRIHQPQWSSSVLGLFSPADVLLAVIKQNFGLRWQKWALLAERHRAARSKLMALAGAPQTSSCPRWIQRRGSRGTGDLRKNFLELLFLIK